MAEVVQRQGHLHPDDAAHVLDVLLQVVQALLRDLNAREGMQDLARVHRVVAVVQADGQLLPIRDRPNLPARRLKVVAPDRRIHLVRLFRIGRPLLHVADGIVQHALLAGQKTDAQVHLQQRVAALQALFQRKAHRLALGTVFGHVRVRVAVDAHLVPELAAEHVVHGDAIRLSRQVPEGDLDAAHAATLPAVEAELLDPAEDFVDVAGVFAQYTALEHERVGLGGHVTHLAKAHDALVGVELQDLAGVRRAREVRKAHVRDAQLRRLRAGIDVLQGFLVVVLLAHE